MRRFSLVGMERTLSALPWIFCAVIWMIVGGVQLLLYLLKPTAEMASVVLWLIPLSFLVLVPGLGGFVCLLLRMRRRRLDTSLLDAMHRLTGGTRYGPGLLLPVVRPRLLTTIAGTPVEILLSPPIPRTRRQTAITPERAAAYQVIERAERAMETADARLGTATWPQLELRCAVDLPITLHLSTRGPTLAAAPGLTEVEIEDPAFADHLRVLSDSPAAASALLGDPELRTSLAAAAGFNQPWATQLTLRPAARGRGAGLYLLTVAGPETTADRLVQTTEQLLALSRHPAWRSLGSS